MKVASFFHYPFCFSKTANKGFWPIEHKAKSPGCIGLRKDHKNGLFKKIFLLVFLSITISGFRFETLAQSPGIGKTLPKPKFYLLGVSEPTFPVFTGNWEDSVKVKQYGELVMQWIEANPQKWNKITQAKANYLQVNFVDFEKFTSDQRAVFKEFSNRLSFALRPQKTKMLREFERTEKNQKGKPPGDFYRDAEQIYLLNIKDINYLRSKLFP